MDAARRVRSGGGERAMITAGFLEMLVDLARETEVMVPGCSLERFLRWDAELDCCLAALPRSGMSESEQREFRLVMGALRLAHMESFRGIGAA